MSLNPLTWVKNLYRAAAASGLAEFHQDLARAAQEAGIDSDKPLTVGTLGELVAKVQPPTPPALPAAVQPAAPPLDNKPADKPVEPAPEPENGRRKKPTSVVNGAV